MEKVASIDIGSNTLRILIAEISEGRFDPVYRDRAIVRLGRNFFPKQLLSNRAIESAIEVLKRFKRKADQEGVGRIRAVGTGVLRQARNSRDFLGAVRREAGLSVEVITGLEEARLSALGVLSVFPEIEGRTVVFDLGGGSTEVIHLEDRRLINKTSLPLGVVTLTERFLHSDPPSRGEMDSLENHCLAVLRSGLSGWPEGDRLIGTAGTVTTLAAMAQGMNVYDPERINRTVLKADRLAGLLERIGSMPQEQRGRLIGLEPGREDVIVAGLAVVLKIMEVFSQESLWISDAGLLEGIVLDSLGI